MVAGYGPPWCWAATTATPVGQPLQTIRPATRSAITFPPHGGELLFHFVLEGEVVLQRGGDHALEACDAFVIPAGEAWGLRDGSAGLRLLQVRLPGG